MNEVSVNLPLCIGDVPVGEYEIIVRPCYDMAVDWVQPLNASDVYFVGLDDRRHPCPEPEKVLEQIRTEYPSVWAEIEAEA